MPLSHDTAFSEMGIQRAGTADVQYCTVETFNSETALPKATLALTPALWL